MIQQQTFFEKIDGLAVTIISIFTAFLAVLASFVTWQYDRKRLSHAENEINTIKNDIKMQNEENENTFERLERLQKESENRIVDKLDDLKMYLLHSKITVKGNFKEVD